MITNSSIKVVDRGEFEVVSDSALLLHTQSSVTCPVIRSFPLDSYELDNRTQSIDYATIP